MTAIPKRIIGYICHARYTRQYHFCAPVIVILCCVLVVIACAESDSDSDTSTESESRPSVDREGNLQDNTLRHPSAHKRRLPTQG
jgi:hypothetical protein